MANLTFDTLKYANILKEAGVPSAQAEAEAKALAEVMHINLNNLVTKEDLVRDLRDLEQRLIIKLGALMTVAIGLVAALVKILEKAG